MARTKEEIMAQHRRQNEQPRYANLAQRTRQIEAARHAYAKWSGTDVASVSPEFICGSSARLGYWYMLARRNIVMELCSKRFIGHNLPAEIVKRIKFMVFYRS